MKIIILCGGKGIRAFPFTKYMPKPMLPLDGSPIITHVINGFINQGFNEFILAAGYRRSVIQDYFKGRDMGAAIDVVDTGEDSNTGERIFNCRDLVGDTFMATYSDGLCDVSIHDLLAFHNSHKGLVTITSVPMYSQYGILDIEPNGHVRKLREKPLIREHWINAGFILFDRQVFNHWQGADLERDVFPNLIKDNLVFSYRHDGFFKSLDSYKDLKQFEEMIQADNCPWKYSKEE